jgi:hypothetical protein
VTVESLLECCVVMVETVDFSSLSSANPFIASLATPTSASKKSRHLSHLKALGNLHSFVSLYGRLVTAAVELLQAEGEKKKPEKQVSLMNAERSILKFI